MNREIIPNAWYRADRGITDVLGSSLMQMMLGRPSDRQIKWRPVEESPQGIATPTILPDYAVLATMNSGFDSPLSQKSLAGRSPLYRRMMGF